MLIHHLDYDLKFTLFIRKCSTALFVFVDLEDDKLVQEFIDDLYDRSQPPYAIYDYISVLAIPICIHVSNDDTWEDIEERTMNVIRQHDLCHYLYRRLNELFSLPDTLTPKLQKLDQISESDNEIVKHSY